jgi:hypothetical protein
LAEASLVASLHGLQGGTTLLFSGCRRI